MNVSTEKTVGPLGSGFTRTQSEPKKTTRAERKQIRLLQKRVTEVQELAAARQPAGWLIVPRPEKPSALGRRVAGKTVGPEPARSSVLLPREESNKGLTPVEGRGKGRPEEYTDEEADTLLAWVQSGGSMRRYCVNTGRSPATLYRWMRQRADFQARYLQAHEDRADTLVDEMIDIADDAAREATIEGVAAAKLRVETRKWISSKMRPQKWGDKQVVEHVGAVSIRIGNTPRQPDLEVLEAVDNRPQVLENTGLDQDA